MHGGCGHTRDDSKRSLQTVSYVTLRSNLLKEVELDINVEEGLIKTIQYSVRRKRDHLLLLLLTRPRNDSIYTRNQSSPEL